MLDRPGILACGLVDPGCHSTGLLPLRLRLLPQPLRIAQHIFVLVRRSKQASEDRLRFIQLLAERPDA